MDWSSPVKGAYSSDSDYYSQTPKKLRYGDRFSSNGDTRPNYRHKKANPYSRRRWWRKRGRGFIKYRKNQYLGSFTGVRGRMPTGTEKYVTLRVFNNCSYKFSTIDPSQSSFDPLMVYLDHGGAFFPQEKEIGPVDAAKFNTSASQKFISAHVYCKDMNIQYYVDDGRKPRKFSFTGQGLSNDTSMYFYVNNLLPYHLEELDPQFMINKGKKWRLPNGAGKYFSLYKYNTYATDNISLNIDQLYAQPVGQILEDSQAWVRTGNKESPVNHRIHFAPANIFPRPDIVDAVDKPVIYAIVKFTLCIATKWRLYGERQE